MLAGCPLLSKKTSDPDHCDQSNHTPNKAYIKHLIYTLDAYTTPSGQRMTTRWSKIPIPVYLPPLHHNPKFKKDIEQTLTEIENKTGIQLFKFVKIPSEITSQNPGIIFSYGTAFGAEKKDDKWVFPTLYQEQSFSNISEAPGEGNWTQHAINKQTGEITKTAYINLGVVGEGYDSLASEKSGKPKINIDTLSTLERYPTKLREVVIREIALALDLTYYPDTKGYDPKGCLTPPDLFYVIKAIYSSSPGTPVEQLKYDF